MDLSVETVWCVKNQVLVVVKLTFETPTLSQTSLSLRLSHFELVEQLLNDFILFYFILFNCLFTFYDDNS